MTSTTDIIGEGTFGVVRLVGHNIVEKRSVNDENAIAEVNVLLNLKHANIIPMIRYAIELKEVIIILPRYDLDLYRFMKIHVVRDCLDMTYQIVCGLCALHGAGYMHRDIKPSNILVNVTLGKDELVIADFGWAVKIDRGRCNTMDPCTWMYRPPEVAVREYPYYTEKIDMFGLGVVMFEMAHKKHPFRISKEESYVTDLKAFYATKPVTKFDDFELRLWKGFMQNMSVHRISAQAAKDLIEKELRL